MKYIHKPVQQRHLPNARHTEFDNRTWNTDRIPVSHARSYNTTVSKMKTSSQVTSTQPMLLVIVALLDLKASSSPSRLQCHIHSARNSAQKELANPICAAFQLHGHPSNVTLGLVITSCVGETLAPMQLRASLLMKICREQGSQTLTLITVNTSVMASTPKCDLLTQVHKP